MRHVKVIYADGATEEYYTDMCASEVWELVREKARAAGTFIRQLVCI